MKKAVIYSRVSTENQEFQRQTTELNEFAMDNKYDVVRVFEEKISGTIRMEKPTNLTPFRQSKRAIGSQDQLTHSALHVAFPVPRTGKE